MPKISVIVPVYRVEKYIYRCVDSILGQTFTDFELILVDDGSPDNCGTICDEYAERDSRVMVIHQENCGLSAARNAGIDWAFAYSDSEWLSFVDSDDWVHPEYLERLLDVAVVNNVDVSVCGYVQTEGEVPEIIGSDIESRILSPEAFFVENSVNATIAWGKLYRKECFLTIRYPVGKIHEDEFTTHRVLFLHERIAVIGMPLYMYFQNVQGITKSGWSLKRLDALDAFIDQLVFFKLHGFYQAYVYRAKGASLFACRIAEMIEQTDTLGSGIKKMTKKKVKQFLRKLFFLNGGVPDHPTAYKEWILLNTFPLLMHTYFAVRKIGRQYK